MESKMRSLVLLLFSGLCLAGAAGVFAQALYKSTMPDGKVIYGEDILAPTTDEWGET